MVHFSLHCSKVSICMVFQTQDRAGELLREMLSMGFAAAALHAAKSKAERDKTVEDFRTGKVSISC